MPDSLAYVSELGRSEMSHFAKSIFFLPLHQSFFIKNNITELNKKLKSADQKPLLYTGYN